MGNATEVLSSAVSMPAETGEHADATCRMRRVVDANFDFLWRVLRRMGVPSGDADDAVQQCFLVISKHLTTIGEAQVRAFLFQTAVRVALNERRRARRRREEGDERLSAVIDPADGPDTVVEQQWARRVLDDLLDTMPTELRTAFVLFELEGFTLREVASTLDVPQGTAASRVRRAREHYEDQVRRLRARMSDGGSR